MNVAIVDLGTNTCRLLLAAVDEDGRLTTVERRTTVVRLGQGVEVDRRLHPEAIRRTRACLHAYAPLLEAFQPRAQPAGGHKRPARCPRRACLPRGCGA